MGLDENLRLPELLAPIPGENPVGKELKYSNEFSEIELAHHQGFVPPIDDRTGELLIRPEDAFGRVVEAAPEFLRTQSKDLRVAAFLTGALLSVGIGPTDDPSGARCFAGLALGFQLLRGMMEEFWDGMYPGMESRQASLSALASPDLTSWIRRAPLTTWGHSHSHYDKLRVGTDNEWLETDPAEAPQDSDKPWTGNFPAAFEETDREYYTRLSEELEGCMASLEALDELGRERFEEAGERPPSYGDLKKALRDMASASAQLLARKPEDPPPESVAGPTDTGGVVVDGGMPGGAGGPEADPGRASDPTELPGQGIPPAAPPAAGPVEPQNPVQAAAAVASAARVLRKENARNPIPYLLLRSLRWGEVRGTDDHIDPKLLEAPRSEARRNLRTLFLEEQWEQLLEATEEVMASEAGRGWLDLQRYAILSADHMGADFKGVTAALRGALRSHLQDLPSLSTAILMDDSAAASADTLQWLEAGGFIRLKDDEGRDEALADDTDPDRVRRTASFARAHQMVQAGDPDGAIQLLMGRADRERSERASFVTRVEAARVMVDRGETSVARPILDQLLKEIDEHNLEDWEAGEVVAKPLGLLVRCFDPAEGQLRQEIYDRICRLDPLLARELGDGNHGD